VVLSILAIVGIDVIAVRNGLDEDDSVVEAVADMLPK
jgi:hypothetical protein